MPSNISGVGVQLKGVSFGYGTQRLLHDISFRVHRGEFVVIIGPNGCGKSTALKILSGIIKARQGQVLIDNQALSDYSRRDLARRLALLAQSGSLPSGMLAYDLVGMGRYAHESWLRRQTAQDREYVERAMARMEVGDLAQRRLSELSGGQLQRIRMAMVLAQDASVLLLDEPTNHLDLKHQHALLAIARQEARKDRAVVAVLHDLTQASLYADRIILMHEGRIIADGAPKSVLSVEAVRKVYGLNTRAHTIGDIVIHLPESMAP